MNVFCLPLLMFLQISPMPPVWSRCQWVTTISWMAVLNSVRACFKQTIYSGIAGSPVSMRILLKIKWKIIIQSEHRVCISMFLTQIIYITFKKPHKLPCFQRAWKAAACYFSLTIIISPSESSLKKTYKCESEQGIMAMVLNTYIALERNKALFQGPDIF